MDKQELESSQRDLRISVNDSNTRPLSPEDQAALATIAAKQEIDDDSGIDYSEIPALTEEELKALRPARDSKHFRRWQDRHFPEEAPAFEEARRRWHEKHDLPKQS